MSNNIYTGGNREWQLHRMMTFALLIGILLIKFQTSEALPDSEGEKGMKKRGNINPCQSGVLSGGQQKCWQNNNNEQCCCLSTGKMKCSPNTVNVDKRLAVDKRCESSRHDTHPKCWQEGNDMCCCHRNGSVECRVKLCNHGGYYYKMGTCRYDLQDGKRKWCCCHQQLFCKPELPKHLVGKCPAGVSSKCFHGYIYEHCCCVPNGKYGEMECHYYDLDAPIQGLRKVCPDGAWTTTNDECWEQYFGKCCCVPNGDVECAVENCLIGGYSYEKGVCYWRYKDGSLANCCCSGSGGIDPFQCYDDAVRPNEGDRCKPGDSTNLRRKCFSYNQEWCCCLPNGKHGEVACANSYIPW